MPAPLLPSFRRQQLVLDFASLQSTSCPEGIYLSLSPDDSAIWFGVLFIREGPYESLISRFTLSFPPTYPTTPPLITFSTDLFHPLVVPLTTYTFSGGGDGAGLSAGDVQGQLPPGAFSLRWGFPGWFEKERARGKGRKSEDGVITGLGVGTGGINTAPPRATGDIPGEKHMTPSTPPPASSSPPLSDSRAAAPTVSTPAPTYHQPMDSTSSTQSVDFEDTKGTTLSVLTHLASSFTDPSLLDTLTLSHAGNPSAWCAWRSYRGLSQTQTHPPSEAEGEAQEQQYSRGRSPGPQGGTAGGGPQRSPRHPSSWNWDGVFESRVRENVSDSLSDSALFGLAHTHGGSAGAAAGGAGQPSLRGGTGVGRWGFGGSAATAGGTTGQIKFDKLDRERLEDIRRRWREGLS